MKPTLLLAFISAAVLSNAAGTFSLIETNPKHGTEEFIWSDSSRHIYGAGELSNITELNGYLYYYGQDSSGNEELWKTDGTQQGTSLVKDINPDGSSMMGNIVTLGNKMIFVASDNNNWDFDLFASDGTTGGTVKIADINQNWNDGLSAQRAARFGNSLLFCTNTDLMKTDGTVAGTESILSIAQYNPAQGYCEMNGNAYFILTDVQGKPQLWMTNGTTAGTHLAFDLGTSSQNIIYVENLLTFNNKLYMVASADGQGSDLFSFDGTNLEHIVLATGGNAYPHSLNVANNQLVFVASNMSHTSLYRMRAGDAVPQIIPSVADLDVYGSMSFCNNAAYFTAGDNMQIHYVNLTDLSHHTINLVNYRIPDYWTSEGGILTGAAGKVFFAAYDTSTNKQVFIESDGTAEGTMAVMPQGVNTDHPFNVILSCGAADIFDFKMWGNKVIVPANFNNAGRELWIYEPQGLASAIEPVSGNELRVSVFPNPTAKELSVRVDGDGYCDKSAIQIMDLTGQIVKQLSFSGNSATMDVSFLPAGNYCLSLTGAEHKTVTRNFVVIK